MANAAEQPFTPPTAEQLVEHLKRCEPIAPPRWWSMLPMIALGAVAALTFTSHNALAALLPGIVLIALVCGLTWRVRSMRALEARVNHAQELALMRHHRQALRLAWRLLPQLRALHDMHGRVVSVLAHGLDQVGGYDAAIVGYDFLIARLPPDHPGAIQLKIQRTIVQLLADHLTDADDALRRLRTPVTDYADTPIGASYRMAELLQQVQTNHYHDAVETPGDLVEQLRPLGVEAGYGYALMALSHHKTGGDSADEWWWRATLLLTPTALVSRFEYLDALTGLPAAPRPKAVVTG